MPRSAALSQLRWPASPPLSSSLGARKCMKRLTSFSDGLLGLEGGARGDDALGRIAPERDQELAGKRHDRDPADPPTPLPDARTEPDAQGRGWLMAEPEPGELDQGVAQAAVAAL